MSVPVPHILPPSSRGFDARRAFDRSTATLLLLVASPYLLHRALLARYRFGRVFDLRPVVGADGAPVALRRFAGLLPGRDLGLLLNVAAGDLAWVGPPAVGAEDASARSTGSAPGLVCRERLQRLTGTRYASDDEEGEPSLSGAIGILGRYLVARLMAPAYGARRPARVEVLGVRVDNLTVDAALDRIGERVATRTPGAFAFVNPDCLNIAAGDADYVAALDAMEAVFADGIGLQIAARMLGVQLHANVNGTDLMPLLCERCVAEGSSLYLLGGREGVAREAAGRLRERFPTLRIAGTAHGYFDAGEEPAVIERINASGADILLVAFGAPRQERWMVRHGGALAPPVRIGVGGLFDFCAGRVSRAPRWLRDLGLEWTWRFLQEPGRMWRRYLVGNPLFLHRVHRQRLREPASRALARFTGREASSLGSVARYRVLHVTVRGVVRLVRRTKRGLDIVGASAALLLLSPLFAVVAAAIRIESPGPVLFHQRRVGRWGEPFGMYKFRSMRTDAEALKAALAADNEMAGGVLFKMKRDPRVTRVGRLIRKYSIDELPQLWNVLVGDMSLVGPRPPVPSEVDQYSLEHRRRLEVRPGLTCLWQVSGRSEIAFEQQVDLDVDYIESHGVLADLKILLRTIPAVLSGKGAY